MAGEQNATLENIVEKLKQVATDLLPKHGKNSKGKATTTKADPLDVLNSLRKCVEDLAVFVQKDQENKVDHETTLKEHEDEIDHLKQKSLKGKIMITSSANFGDCLIKSEAQLKDENKTLTKHVTDLAKLKYNVDITEDDVASCFRLKKGGILVNFWKKWKGSPFQNLVSKIRSAEGSNMNLYFNFMLTPRRGELLYEIRKLKKDGRINKFYSDEEGSISIKLNRGENKVRVTDIFDGSGKLKTWTLGELFAAC